MTSIREVRGKRDLQRFVTAGRPIYAGDPNWVEPLHAEVRGLLTPGRNPFWNHASRTLYLAEDGGRVVGRIAAIVDQNHDSWWNERAGFFGFFESVEDGGVAAALFAAAEEWLRGRGATFSRGPLNPSTNEECGLLVEGFDGPPRIMMPYNPPYYADLICAEGYRKAMDLLAYDMKMSSEMRDRLARIAGRVKRKFPGLTVRAIDLSRGKDELNVIKTIYNDAWGRNWGFVPMTDQEIDDMAAKLKPLLDPTITAVAFVDGEPAGFLLNLPDFNLVIRDFRGRLTPWNLAKLLLRKGAIKGMRLLTLGLRHKYLKSGIDACLYRQGLEGVLARGIERAEFSWILETNAVTRNVSETFGGRLYRTYRVYEKDLAAR